MVSAALGTIAAQPLMNSLKKHMALHWIINSVIALTVLLMLITVLLLQYEATWLLLAVLFLQGMCLRLGMVSLNLMLYGKMSAVMRRHAVVVYGIGLQLSNSFSITFVAMLILLSTGTNWLDTHMIPLTGLQVAFAGMIIFPVLALWTSSRQTRALQWEIKV